MVNSQQTLAGGLHGRSGSFYVTDLDDESRIKVHAYSSASASTPTVSGFNSIADAALGSSVSRVYGRMVKWSPEYLAVHGQNLSRRVVFRDPGTPAMLMPATGSQAGRYAQGVLAQMDVLFDDGFVRYGLMIPEGLRPETINSTSGLLFAGTDFTAYPGFIVMTADPAVEFPTGIFEVAAGTQVSASPQAYPSGGKSGPADRRMFYMRSAQSVYALEKAACEAAGLIVTRGADTVIDIMTTGSSTLYFMASGTFHEVAYTHTPLVLGTKVSDGTVISLNPGPQVRVCASAYDFASLAWDLRTVSTTRADLLPTDADYAAVANDIFVRYTGRLILVRPGATIAADAVRLAAFKGFITRHLPVVSLVIFEKS